MKIVIEAIEADVPDEAVKAIGAGLPEELAPVLLQRWFKSILEYNVQRWEEAMRAVGAGIMDIDGVSARATSQALESFAQIRIDLLREWEEKKQKEKEDPGNSEK